jgi:hypothetical protein
MAAEIGSWVKWGKLSPTRLGYQACDIGRVIAVRQAQSGGSEIDVQFADGDVIRGAFEQWFEGAQFATGDETSPHLPLAAGEKDPQ